MHRGIARVRSSPVGLLLACALLLRALIPAGWMPAAGQGLTIEICADGAGGADPAFAAAAQRQFREALGPAADRQGDGHGADHPGKSEPCAFAGLAFAWTGAGEGPMLPPPAAEDPAPRAVPQAVSVGRGLAAPPPPSTGPPLTA